MYIYKLRFKPNPNNLNKKEIKNIVFKHEKKSFTKISKEELSSLREINIWGFADDRFFLWLTKYTNEGK